MAVRSLLRMATVGAACLAAPALADDWTWPLPAWMPPPPVPDDNAMSEAKVDLGRHLFYDARLSRDGTVACASCHVQERSFSDGRATATGISGMMTVRNAQSLANVAYFPALTWANPHMTSLEFQALTPLLGDMPQEMGGAGHDIRIFAELSTDPVYRDGFAAVFPRHAEPDLYTVTRALAAFQRSLLSFDSPYDRYARGGDDDAIPDAAKAGEELFFSHRFECYHCHSGNLFTDNQQIAGSPWTEVGFHNTGLYETYAHTAPGLIEFTGRPEDAGRMRTPSLRNVAVTAPYMHDGSIPDLRGVIEHYLRGGRATHPYKDSLIAPTDATEKEIAQLIAFLESLTDTTFLTDPAHADPWPADHPARAYRMDP